jgi:AraC family transcriptional regulator
MFNVTFPTKNVPALIETTAEPFFQRLYSSEQRWEGIAAQVYQFPPPREPLNVQQKDQAIPWDHCDLISLHLHNTVDLQRQIGARLERGISYRGGICLEPKGYSGTYFWQGKEPAVVLFLYLAPSLLEQVVAEMGRYDPRQVEMVKQFNFRDPLIEQLGLSLVAELESGGVAGRVYAESLANALVLHLLRLSSTASLLPPSSQRNLTQRRISIVQDIPLKDLASSLGMSVSHFCRLFKQSTGQAPHQYMIACRVERAKSLLLQGERTLAQVAHAVGFADQSHLNRHFKHLLGIPPGVLREESKNLQAQEKNVQDQDSHERVYSSISM